MTHFVYILYSENKDRYYVGSSSDVETRLQRHNAGATPSTKSGRPWKAVYEEEYPSKQDALKRENHIKRMKSRVYIERLIDSSVG
ncbi:GIY-YIG nuclease family protein [Marinilabilia sp.]